MMTLDFLKKDRNATVIITSNDREVAMQCDKVLYLSQGKIKGFDHWETISKQLNA